MQKMDIYPSVCSTNTVGSPCDRGLSMQTGAMHTFEGLGGMDGKMSRVDLFEDSKGKKVSPCPLFCSCPFSSSFSFPFIIIHPHTNITHTPNYPHSLTHIQWQVTRSATQQVVTRISAQSRFNCFFFFYQRLRPRFLAVPENKDAQTRGADEKVPSYIDQIKLTSHSLSSFINTVGCHQRRSGQGYDTKPTYFFRAK